MTNEVAHLDEGTLEVFPPAQPPSASARAMLREHAQMMNDAYQLARGICGDGKTGTGLMVPQRFRGKPEEAAAAMIYGAELGLNPLQAVQRVVPIHGMPTLESRTMVGLLKARGYKIRAVEQSDTSVTVEGVAPDGETASSTWTIDRAAQAGYVPIPVEGSRCRPTVDEDWVTVTKQWGNDKPKTSVVGNMKYITDPQTMLKAKAQAEVCRELAPDVLMGISYSREELESEDQRQFDRGERSAPARVSTKRVTEDEIFADEAPIPDHPGPATSTSDNPAKVFHADVTPGSPAGDVEDQGAEQAAPVDPSPAEQPAPATSTAGAKPEPAQVAEPPKKAPAKKASAKKAAPREVSKLRPGLEKRTFGLLGDAGLSSDEDRDGRIAVYRAILNRADIESTNDLSDVEVTQIGDQLYRWKTDGDLADEIAGILFEAARDAETTTTAPAVEPTIEGTE